MLRMRSLVVAGLLGLGVCAQAADFAGENLVEVKLALPKGDTYLRGGTDPVLDLVAEITLLNVSKKEKREKETITFSKADFLGVDERIALENTLKGEQTKDAMLAAINSATEKKQGKGEKDVWPVNAESVGVAYVEPQLGPHDNIVFIITKQPEEGQTAPEGAKPVLIPRDGKPDAVARVDLSETKYLAAGESSPPFTLPVGKYYLIRDPGLYSIKAVLRQIGNNTKGGKFAESNEEKFRVLAFKKVEQKIEELRRNWEFYERGMPDFEYQLYEVQNAQGYDEIWWVQRIKVRGVAQWEWQRLCTVKAGTQPQIAHLGPKKLAVLAMQAKGDAGLYTLDFNTIGAQVTAKIIEVKEGAAPKLKVEGGAPSVE